MSLATWPFILSAIRGGLSGAKTLRALRSGGFSIGNERFYDLFRHATYQEALSSQLKYVRRTFYPNPNRIPEAITKLSRKFVFTVRIRGKSLRTGEMIEDFRSIATDQNMRRIDIENAVKDRASLTDTTEPVEILEATLFGGVKSGISGTLL